jgi:hypothetical protein
LKSPSFEVRRILKGIQEPKKAQIQSCVKELLEVLCPRRLKIETRCTQRIKKTKLENCKK